MSIRRAVALILLAAVIALVWVQAGQEARVYEYSILAPKVERAEQTNAGSHAEEDAQDAPKEEQPSPG